MSDISFEKENNIIINKTKITDNSEIYIPKSKKVEISEDEKDNSELSNKNKISSELPDTSSGSESPIHFNNNIFIEPINPISQNNNQFDKIITNRIISPELNYFLCNEQYIKEKYPEGNNYKDKSKNYKLKTNFIDSKIKIEDIEINKINNILQDIELAQNNINNNYNSIINIGQNGKEEINELSFLKDESFNVDNNLLCSYVNNYIFNCKKLIYIFF